MAAVENFRMSTPQSFLDTFEQIRLATEARMLRLPEASRLLAERGDLGQRYLHALPTVLALVRLLCHAPRAAGRLTERMEAVGPAPQLSQDSTARSLTCFALGTLYRAVAKRADDPGFAQQVARLGTLTALGAEALERVDWVVQVQARARRGAGQDWLAPALLLGVWLTGIESSSRARRLASTLEELDAFVNQALEEALMNRIHLQFPW